MVGSSDDAALTLDVWDAKLAEVGDQFGHARAVLVARLTPVGRRGLRAARRSADQRRAALRAAVARNGVWPPRLAEARSDDVRRGVSTVGPHRDDLELFIDGMPARTHASQGEQRTLALALRLAAHRLVTDKAGSAPVLVLDDVLSELDPGAARRCCGTCRPARSC